MAVDNLFLGNSTSNITISKGGSQIEIKATNQELLVKEMNWAIAQNDDRRVSHIDISVSNETASYDVLTHRATLTLERYD